MLGEGIRAERVRRGLSQAQLARMAGLSASGLSQIESGIKRPSISSLRRIASALNVSFFRFLVGDDDPTRMVVRRDQRRTMTFPKSALTYQALTPDSAGTLEMLSFRLDAGGSSAPEPFSHPSDECLLVLSGTVHIQVEGEKHVLKDGDSIYIPRGLRHLVRNGGTDTVEVVFAISPPRF